MADIDVTITIPDIHVARVIAAFVQVGGSELTFQANDNAGFASSYSVDMPEKGADSSLVFGKKFIKSLILGAVKVSEQYDEDTRYANEVAVITPPTVNVPDTVIT